MGVTVMGRILIIVVFFLVALAAAEETNFTATSAQVPQEGNKAEGVDSWWPEFPRDVDGRKEFRLAFASCAKQKPEEQKIFEALRAEHPDGFIWMGDAIYPECPEDECLRRHYKKQSKFKEYREFVNEVPFVDGVWDDHDYGLNDGDGLFWNKRSSLQLFLDFIGVAKSSSRREREGAYSSHLFGQEPYAVKVIMMDLRYMRAEPFTPNLGEIKLPLFSQISAILRLLSFATGAGYHYDGDMLGDAQWKWLDAQLRNSTANVHILVSSIQMLAKFPMVESWGHFPVSLQRLKNLLADTQPRGLIVLSGDVHLAELNGDKSSVVEVTSSGLTHSQNFHYVKWLLGIFSSGRLTSDALPPVDGNGTRSSPQVDPAYEGDGFFLGHNFGILNVTFTGPEDDWTSRIDATVMDKFGTPRLRAVIVERSGDDVGRRFANLLEVPMLIQPPNVWMILMAMLAMLGLCVVVVRRFVCRKRRASLHAALESPHYASVPTTDSFRSLRTRVKASS